MLYGYRAVLKGDKLEWTEAAPPTTRNGGVPVYVFVIPSEGEEKDIDQRRERLSEAFERLRESKAFAEIADPVAWQREMRPDRPLIGRDDG